MANHQSIQVKLQIYRHLNLTFSLISLWKVGNDVPSWCLKLQYPRFVSIKFEADILHVRDFFLVRYLLIPCDLQLPKRKAETSM